MNTAQSSNRRLLPRQELVARARPVVEKFGSISGWKGEDTRLTNVHAAGVTGWLNREILPTPKSFENLKEMSLKEIFDQVYRVE